MHRSIWYRIKKHFDLLPLPPSAVFSAVLQKKNALSRMKDTVETLVVGSSHGKNGFHAINNEFNFCITSQDLYTGYEIYKKYADLKNLKTVILFYSVFSPGFEEEMTNDHIAPVLYKMILNIPYRYPERYNYKKIEKKLAKSLSNILFDNTDACSSFDARGNYDYSVFCTNADAKERADGHLKNNARENRQTKYVAEMQKLAEERGHALVVVIPPARSDYMRYMPPCETVFKDLFALKNVRVLNYFGNPDFSDDDFGDTDHLNLQGALKLSGFIRDALGFNAR